MDKTSWSEWQTLPEFKRSLCLIVRKRRDDVERIRWQLLLTGSSGNHKAYVETLEEYNKLLGIKKTEEKAIEIFDFFKGKKLIATALPGHERESMGDAMKSLGRIMQ